MAGACWLATGASIIGALATACRLAAVWRTKRANTQLTRECGQVLIGGGGGAGLNLADMRAHVNYAGGYHEEHPVIQELWRVRRCLAAAAVLGSRLSALSRSACGLAHRQQQGVGAGQAPDLHRAPRLWDGAMGLWCKCSTGTRPSCAWPGSPPLLGALPAVLPVSIPVFPLCPPIARPVLPGRNCQVRGRK